MQGGPTTADNGPYGQHCLSPVLRVAHPDAPVERTGIP